MQKNYEKFVAIFTFCLPVAVALAGALTVTPAFSADLNVELETYAGPYAHKVEGRLEESSRLSGYEQVLPTIETAGPKSDAEARERARPVAIMAEKPSPKGDILKPSATTSVAAASVGVKAVSTGPDLGAGRKIDYVAINQPVDQVMRELGQAVGLRVIGNGLTSNVRKRHLKGEFSTLMDGLAQEFGLVWFADGGVVYAETLENQKTRIVPLKNVGAEQLYESMDMMGLGRVKSHVVVAPGEGTARVTGPDSLQKAVDNILITLKPPEDPDIKVIKYGTRVN